MIFLGGHIYFLLIEIRAVERVECSQEAGNPAAYEKRPRIFGGVEELLLAR